MIKIEYKCESSIGESRTFGLVDLIEYLSENYEYDSAKMDLINAKAIMSLKLTASILDRLLVKGLIDDRDVERIIANTGLCDRSEIINITRR